ncbi:MAG: SDR family oxidoreductase [Chloroflexota bacterium]
MILKDKVVLVTGAGRGLGAGVARACGQAGAYVYATDIDEVELAQTLADMARDGSTGEAHHLDVADLVAFQTLVEEIVANHNRLDALIHCAAIMPQIPFAETTTVLWQRELNINLGGFVHGTQLVWEQMKQQGGGHLVAVASGASVRGYADEVMYCAGKHALEGFVKALAFEAAPYNIGVNTIGPGKLIKPTGITRAELAQMSDEEKAKWIDPTTLSEAFVWLVAQPPQRFSGLRLDAGPIIDTIAAEGYDFAFAPEKVTLYVDDLASRRAWQAAGE